MLPSKVPYPAKGPPPPAGSRSPKSESMLVAGPRSCNSWPPPTPRSVEAGMRDDELESRTVAPETSPKHAEKRKRRDKPRRRPLTKVASREKLQHIHAADASCQGDPAWRCACGAEATESQRRTHLRDCALFKRSWFVATKAVLKSIDASRAPGPGRVGDQVLRPPPTFDERVEAIIRKLRYRAAKANQQHNPPWWSRGAIVASLIESGGDYRKAAAKLLQENETTALAYRSEMTFVAEAVDIEIVVIKIAAGL